MATVVIQANANRKNWPTINIIATAPPKGGQSHKQATAASNTLGQFKTYQPTASPTSGLKTIYISGYSGPA